jgi:hypothetical protein
MTDSFDYGAGAVVAPNGTKRHQIASNASRPGGPLVSRRVRGQCGRVAARWAGLSQDTDAFATTGRGLWKYGVRSCTCGACRQQADPTLPTAPETGR